MGKRGFFGGFIAKALHAAGDNIQHRIGNGADPASISELVDQFLHDAPQGARFAVADIPRAGGGKMIRLAGSPATSHVRRFHNRSCRPAHCRRAGAGRCHNAASFAPAGDKNFAVRPKQALRPQNGKTGMRVGLRQQVDHLLAGRLAAGKLVGEAVWTGIFLDITMMVIIKIER